MSLRIEHLPLFNSGGGGRREGDGVGAGGAKANFLVNRICKDKDS